MAACAAFIFSSILFSSSSIALADQPSSTTNHGTSASQPSEVNASDPEQTGKPEHGRPLHRIDEEREGGFEKVQLIFVGAAIVIALGLAYRAGRRRRDS